MSTSEVPRAADGGPAGGTRPADRPAEGAPDAVETLWQRFLPLVEERVQTLEGYLDGTASREDARRAAHALAGALGSYGRAEGSRLAAQLEELFGGRDGATDGTDEAVALQRLRELVVGLRASL